MMVRMSSLEAGSPSLGCLALKASPNFNSMRGWKAEQPHGAL